MTTTLFPSSGRPKAATGIEGLDEITGGGIPRGRATLVLGGPGCGKTVLALQTLVSGARDHGEAGIFVAFEESAQRIVANAATFGWDLPALQRRKLFFLDAYPSVDFEPAGGFDLQGLLAALDAKMRVFQPSRIVFDAVDVLLDQLSDPTAARREINRLHEWLLARRLTALITAKEQTGGDRYGFMQFMTDCAVVLKHDVALGVSQRSLRVLKYRGSTFAENESPLVIGTAGIEVVGSRKLSLATRVSHERISSGVAGLDQMLAGGYHRGASILITGSPGTAKTTLGGAFAEAACRRGERTLYVSFDSEPGEVVRNLASVNVRLVGFVRKGMLRLHSARASTHSAEVHLLRIKALAREQNARCLVIDPISALAKQGNELTAHSVVERLVDWSKDRGITLVCSSLLARADPQTESTELQISTIADTWIHLSYVIHGGERNRAVTIVKSRGTAHSNQVRELVLTSRGVRLADVSTVGGHVLMGSLRWQQEQAAEAEQNRARGEMKRKRLELEAMQARIQGQVDTLVRELELKRSELDQLAATENARVDAHAHEGAALFKLRGGKATESRNGTARGVRPRHP